MTHKFKPGPAKLVNGMQAKIYEVMEDGRIFGAYYHEGDKRWMGAHWHPDGRYLIRCTGPLDLVPPEPGRPAGWLNVYRREDGEVAEGGRAAETKSEADKRSERTSLKRTHCIDLSDPALDKFRVDLEDETND